jgi:hypothetical protein
MLVSPGQSSDGLEIYSDIARELDGMTFAQPDPSEADPVRNPDLFRVRLARPRTIQMDAGQLVQRRYEWRGYQAGSQGRDPNLFTFAAYNAGALVGTMGMRFDSPAGLPADELYKREIDRLRSQGQRLTEFTRLAVDEAATSKEVLGALFHTAFLYAHQVRGCSHVIIEVNPRHVAFYRRVLFFRQVGEERYLDRVGAPAVLLALDFAEVGRALDAFFAQPDWRQQTKSFFVHWFSPADAPGVLARLQRLDLERQASAHPAAA